MQAERHRGLKSMGYATGQFGKNHLGDLNKYLPWSTASTNSTAICITSTRCPIRIGSLSEERVPRKYGPRNVLHCWATDADDPTVQPRWGKIGKQKIVDEGPLLRPKQDLRNTAQGRESATPNTT